VICAQISRPHFTGCAIASLLLLALAPSARPQDAENQERQPTLPLQTAEEINQRLQLADENLAHSAVDATEGDSRIGPDDLLDITVFEAPEMNRTLRVSNSGELSFELLGAVHVAGLTPREVEAVLQEMLRRSYLKDPHVGVFVHEWQSHSVSVVGAVKMPGVFQIRGAKTLIEVLSMAQGLADDAGDLVLITHAPPDAEAENSGASDPAPPAAIDEIDLRKLLNSPDSAENVPIHSGDIVKVPRAGIVYVVGEVNRPGGFVLQNNENISVLQALALAQGLTHTSAISRARIIRTDATTGKRAEIPMNLGKILAGKSADTLLQAKDVVFVPNSATKSVLYRGSEAALQTAAGIAIYKW
jgi:polysaccharide export outer membrane protein